MAVSTKSIRSSHLRVRRCRRQSAPRSSHERRGMKARQHPRVVRTTGRVEIGSYSTCCAGKRKFGRDLDSIVARSRVVRGAYFRKVVAH